MTLQVDEADIVDDVVGDAAEEIGNEEDELAEDIESENNAS